MPTVEAIRSLSHDEGAPVTEREKTIAEHLEDLACNLVKRMTEAGMTEKGLAKASGISPRTVGNFLRPANRNTRQGTSKSFPSGTLANLFLIAQALDVEAWELLCPGNDARERFHTAIEAAYAQRRASER
jgi:transcriptional regulator with XRE-family HTH domain